MGAHSARPAWLDTGDSTPILDTRVELLVTDRHTALATARAASAEALTDIAGRVAR